MNGLKLPDGWSSIGLVLGQETWVFNPGPYATKKGECGKGHCIRQKYVSGSDLPVFFRCEISSPPWMVSSAEWDKVLLIVELLWGKW